MKETILKETREEHTEKDKALIQDNETSADQDSEKAQATEETTEKGPKEILGEETREEHTEKNQRMEHTTHTNNNTIHSKETGTTTATRKCSKKPRFLKKSKN